MDSELHDPFHVGERALQRRVGVRERLAEVGAQVMRDHMPEPHRAFFGQLPFLLVGSVDGDGQPHASLLAGPPGFAGSPDARTLAVRALPLAADPLAHALRRGASLGVLGIEPHTRRRNRLNGVVSAVHGDGFAIDVQQSFGNCPKYIQARQARWHGGAAATTPGPVVRLGQLDEAGLALVRSADTYFIASSVVPQQFVRVERGTDGVDTLTVPDFSGNNLFNTLGNLSVHPRAGLLFIDFERGTLMQLSVDSEIVWDGTEVASFAGAQRLLRHRVREMRRHDGASALRWDAAQPSPFLRATGCWPAAA